MKKNKISKKLIAVVGPTAGGKTSLGVFLAREYNGEIISADSRQVYRGLDIGTGKEGTSNLKPQTSNLQLKTQKLKNQKTNKKSDKLTIQQLNQYTRYIDDVPQWLIDICEPGEKFTMFDWLAAARKSIDDVFARGKTPIVVGGTGLYVQALIQGFELKKSQTSNLKPQIYNSKLKKYSREELKKKTLADLQSLANKLKPKAHNLDMNNPHRLIRAIERAQSGLVTTKNKPNFEALQIGVEIPREDLYKRIDQRVDEWFEQGFSEEVHGLLKSGVDPKWLMKIGLEYGILSQYLICHPEFISGSCEIPRSRNKFGMTKLAQDDKSFQEMKQRMKFAIHAFARRQLTWFRRFREINWVADRNQAELFVKKFL